MIDPSKESCSCCDGISLASKILGGVGILAGLAAGAALTPVAFAVATFAVPYFGFFRYWSVNGHYEWLAKKTLVNDAREENGPTKEKDYTHHIMNSKFKTVEDLNWLWYEYKRLQTGEIRDAEWAHMAKYSYLFVPVIGIYIWYFSDDADIAEIDVYKNDIPPSQQVQLHFNALHDQLVSKYRDEGNFEMAEKIENTRLQSNHNYIFTS